MQNGNFPRAAAEAYLASRSDHIMTYSRTGKRILQSNGINSGKITAIGNSTDTAALAEAIELQQSQKLPPKHARAVFVGGLDASKRIPFILKAAARARLLEPSFKLAIYGRGDLQSVVEREAQERPEVEYLGVAGVTELAQEAYLSSAIWMPGRVGLIAVDAVAMGIPVHTTDHPYHAPEVDFLTEGVTLQLLPNDPSEFAKASLIAMQQPSKIQRSWAPSVGQVAARMHRVIIDTLS